MDIDNQREREREEEEEEEAFIVHIQTRNESNCAKGWIQTIKDYLFTQCIQELCKLTENSRIISYVKRVNIYNISL